MNERRRIRWVRSIGLCTLLLLCGMAGAQPYWVQDLGGGGNDHIADVQTDASGGIYVTGEFSGTIDFGGGSYASSGSIDFFVARLDADGELVWFKQGGGAGIDRGLKLALGDGGVLAVTGEFLGTANFQGETMTSAGGTADMFVALLNSDDGGLQWLRQGGGPDGTDRPGGVSIAGDGSVCVAGEFRGTATWDGSDLTSMIDPDTGQPSSDVFVAKWSASGVLQWLRKGTAKYADRAVDVVHDDQGNIYVTGQYSDTITFDQIHNNILLNASFLIRMDAAGTENWFRSFGGAGFNHVRDLVLAADGRLILTGDIQGTMVWSGPPTANVPAGFSDAYYLLAVNTSGQLLQQGTMGSDNGVGVNAVTVSGNDVAVLGWFECQFTGLADHYEANGLFMASGTQDLFIARHNASSFVLQEAQQFGGRSAKVPGAVAHVDEGQLVFCGSFQQSLIFPAEPGFTSDMGTGGGGLQGNGVTEYCNDPNYGSYAGSLSEGLTDGFVARGYVEEREPYDWWLRSGTGCDRDTLEPCIRQSGGSTCPDTITVCGPAGLNVFTRYSHIVGNSLGYLGPAITYQWSTGSIAPTISANQTGWYWVTITTVNGCWDWTDSVYVVVLPLPPLPLVSDDVVVNTSTASPDDIILCDPETHWVWGTNTGVAASVEWSMPFGGVISGDSVQVDTSGFYTITYTGANGCTRSTTVQVFDYPAPEMPELELDVAIDFTQDVDGNDSLTLCPGEGVGFIWTATWTVNGVVGAPLPPGLTMYWGILPDEPTTQGSDAPQQGSEPPDGPGWFVLDLIVRVVNAPCGEDTLEFNWADSIHVELYPSLEVDVTLAGPEVLCDGDTTVLVATCIGCGEMNWSSSTGILLSPDSLLVTQGGTYTVTASVTDTTGCSFSDQASITIDMPTAPTLNVDPANGIICPGANATLSTTLTGTDPIWYGPQGPITGQGTSLTTNVPGEYYLTMVIDGCLLTSNNVALAAYGTPYLDVQPTGALCHPGDAVQINVLTVPGAVVQWAPPIGGSALSVTVTQPGTYTCTVMACGITTPLSVEITSSPASAQLLTPGPYNLCGGDSVILSGAPGAGTYTWLPGPVDGIDLTVTAAGDYTLVVTNEAGCTDTTAAVHVDQILFSGPLLITGDTVCAGDAAVLQASGTDPVHWYAGPGFTNQLGTGPSLTFVPAASMMVLARQEDSGCIGDSASAFLLVKPRPPASTVTGPHELCVGDELLIQATAPDSVTLAWSTPIGNVSGPEVYVTQVGPLNTGSYICVPSYAGCNGTSSVHPLVVHVPQDPELQAETTLCLGGAVTFTLPQGYTEILWSTGSTAESIMVGSTSTIVLEAKDANGCPVSDTMDVIVEECDLIVPNIFTPNGDGPNDAWSISGGYTDLVATIYNRWGMVVYEGDIVAHPWDGTHMNTGGLCSEGVYYYVLHLQRFRMEPLSMAGYIQLLR